MFCLLVGRKRANFYCIPTSSQESTGGLPCPSDQHQDIEREFEFRPVIEAIPGLLLSLRSQSNLEKSKLSFPRQRQISVTSEKSTKKKALNKLLSVHSSSDCDETLPKPGNRRFRGFCIFSIAGIPFLDCFYSTLKSNRLTFIIRLVRWIGKLRPVILWIKYWVMRKPAVNCASWTFQIFRSLRNGRKPSWQI